MTDDLLNYYANNYVGYGVADLFDITFREFLTQPEVYLRMTFSIVIDKRIFA